MIHVTLQKKLQVFSDGGISDISGFVGKSFSEFYTYVSLNIHQKKELVNYLEKQNLSGFIDMKKVTKHLENQFKLPVQDMLQLLKKYQKITQNGISELDETLANTDSFQANILQKRKILQYNLEQIEKNMYKLEEIIK